VAFNQSRLLEILKALPDSGRLLVGYSGGMDSHVLLHAVWGLRNELKLEMSAVHVNHGLQSDAEAWADSCADFCRSQQIPIAIIQVDATPEKGESPEAAARDSRYCALHDLMLKGDILLTAHHSDDQAETVLLQLLRGSGPSGLSAMPIISGFGPGFHARPLLEFSRAELAEYAQHNRLQWLEDFSNSDTSFDRNFLRQEVVPLLKQRWPAMHKTLSRSSTSAQWTTGLRSSLAVSISCNTRSRRAVSGTLSPASLIQVRITARARGGGRLAKAVTLILWS